MDVEEQTIKVPDSEVNITKRYITVRPIISAFKPSGPNELAKLVSVLELLVQLPSDDITRSHLLTINPTSARALRQQVIEILDGLPSDQNQSVSTIKEIIRNIRA